jgi:hypothetical protein
MRNEVKMYKLIVSLLLFIVAISANAKEDEMQSAFVFYGVKELTRQGVSSDAAECVLSNLYASLSDEEKGYLQLGVDLQRSDLRKTHEEVTKLLQQQYDFENKITNTIQKKAETLETVFREKCLEDITVIKE